MNHLNYASYCNISFKISLCINLFKVTHFVLSLSCTLQCIVGSLFTSAWWDCICVGHMTLSICIRVCLDAAKCNSAARLAALHVHWPAAPQPEHESDSEQQAGERHTRAEAGIMAAGKLGTQLLYHMIVCSYRCVCACSFNTGSTPTNYYSKIQCLTSEWPCCALCL